MRKLLVLLTILSSISLFAQDSTINSTLTEEGKTQLKEHELTLKTYLDSIRYHPKEDMRKAYCEKFIPKLVEALKIENSYQYGFDSLGIVSILTAPDNSFRIFTWMLVNQDQTYRYYGAIQKNSSKLELTPLLDKSMDIGSPATKILEPKEWFGSIYYNIHQIEDQGTTYYLLFGWDGHNDKSDKKIAEVLYFEDGQAKFGAPIFEITKNNKLKTINRFMLEFKDGALVNLNYNAEKDLIVYDYLTTEDGKDAAEAMSSHAFVPDGTYQAFEFSNGKYRVIPKLFDTILQTAPRPKPVLGNTEPSKKKKSKRP